MSQKPSQSPAAPAPVARQVDDGIHRVVETFNRAPGSNPFTAAELREFRRALILAVKPFETMLDPVLREWADVEVGQDADPAALSAEWYALSIRTLVRALRVHLARNPEDDQAHARAFRL